MNKFSFFSENGKRDYCGSLNYLCFHWAGGNWQSIVFDVQLVWDGHGWVEQNVVLTIGQVLRERNSL
jgi:hypothetical protein